MAKKAAELRRQAADKRKENEDIRHAAAENRKSELHSKRLAVLDAQIARFATPKLTATDKPARPSEPDIHPRRSQAA